MTVAVQVSPAPAMPLPARRTEAPCVPDFVVIGAMKAGTTTLYQHLAAHHDVGMSAIKETDFFIREKNLELGRAWYRSQFRPGFRLYGEVSPNYTKHDIFPGVPTRLAETAPEARIIFIARDPVERTLSHYAHSWLLGHMRVPPEDLLASPNGAHMLETSRYAAQIETWLRSFPRERFLFLDFDVLARDPQAVTNQVFDFLGLPRMPVDARRANDAEEIGRMPGFAQRLWRTRAMRRLDPLITKGMRERARRALVRGRSRQTPPIGEAVRAAIAARLAEDAACFRRMTRMEFARWSV